MSARYRSGFVGQSASHRSVPTRWWRPSSRPSCSSASSGSSGGVGMSESPGSFGNLRKRDLLGQGLDQQGRLVPSPLVVGRDTHQIPEVVLVVGHPVLGFPRLFSQPFGDLLERVDDLLAHDPKTELAVTPGQPTRTALDGINVILIIVLATTLVLFLTEITSNAATATMILPVMAAFAVSLGVHP